MTLLSPFDPWEHVHRPEPAPALATLATLAGGGGDSRKRENEAPAAWARAIATLWMADPPLRFTPERWRELLFDCERLATQWGFKAAALGWSALDLFGCSPGFARRLDRDGLAMMLHGRPVLALDADAAAIGNPSGPPNVYRRGAKAEAVLIWEAGRLGGGGD